MLTRLTGDSGSRPVRETPAAEQRPARRRDPSSMKTDATPPGPQHE
jgi:hypothetical protein